MWKIFLKQQRFALFKFFFFQGNWKNLLWIVTCCMFYYLEICKPWKSLANISVNVSPCKHKEVDRGKYDTFYKSIDFIIFFFLLNPWNFESGPTSHSLPLFCYYWYADYVIPIHILTVTGYWHWSKWNKWCSSYKCRYLCAIDGFVTERPDSPHCNNETPTTPSHWLW